MRQIASRPMLRTISTLFAHHELVFVSNVLCSRRTLPAGAVPVRIAWLAGSAAAPAAMSRASFRPPWLLEWLFAPVHSATTPVS